jgi:hypothetical protein
MKPANTHSLMASISRRTAPLNGVTKMYMKRRFVTETGFVSQAFQTSRNLGMQTAYVPTLGTPWVPAWASRSGLYSPIDSPIALPPNCREGRNGPVERWARLGSNQGPPACEAGALPLSYAPRAARVAAARESMGDPERLAV